MNHPKSETINSFQGKYETEIKEELKEYSLEQQVEILILRLVRAQQKKQENVYKCNFSFSIENGNETEVGASRTFGKSLKGKIIFRDYYAIKEEPEEVLNRKKMKEE